MRSYQSKFISNAQFVERKQLELLRRICRSVTSSAFFFVLLWFTLTHETEKPLVVKWRNSLNGWLFTCSSRDQRRGAASFVLLPLHFRRVPTAPRLAFHFDSARCLMAASVRSSTPALVERHVMRLARFHARNRSGSRRRAIGAAAIVRRHKGVRLSAS